VCHLATMIHEYQDAQELSLFLVTMVKRTVQVGMRQWLATLTGLPLQVIMNGLKDP
jgi:hypothetical protein